MEFPAYLDLSSPTETVRYFPEDHAPPPPQPPTVPPLSQRDPRWKNVLLGHSYYTIGSQGCALLIASMACGMLPLELQDLLKPAGGFWRANLNWVAIPQVVPGMAFDGITNWADRPADVAAVIAELAQHPTGLWIDYSPGGSQNSHFVLGLRYLEEFEDIEIIDPWDGAIVRLLSRYAITGWDLGRALYGMRPLYRVADTPAAMAAADFVAQSAEPQFDNFPEEYTGD